MRLSTSLVAVKRITINTLRSNFSEEKLEEVAKLILQAKGLINPILVRRTGINSFEVVSGDFEYYAAVKAREIDPKLGEMIEAFILEEGNENVLQEQVKLLRSLESVQSPVIDSPDNLDDSRLSRIETQQANLESRIEQRLKELSEASVQEIKLLRNDLKEITRKIPIEKNSVQEIQLLRDDFKESLNKISDLIETLKTPGITKTGKTASRTKIPESAEVLAAFNNLNKDELNNKLEPIRFSRKKIDVIEAILKARDEKKFASLDDVIERVMINQRGKKPCKGMSEEKMLEIVDSWS